MSEINENKLNNKQTTGVNGGSQGHGGIEKSYPRRTVCQDCKDIFEIKSEDEYNNLTNNYTGFYCSNCRDKHKK